MHIIKTAMKKLAFSTSVISFLTLATTVFADTITIQKPASGIFENVDQLINNSLRLAFIVGLVAVLIMLVWGAIEWIFSGGSKEGLEGARKRIINALIGFAILAISFAIIQLAGTFLGINLLQTFTVPTPKALPGQLSAP